MAEVQPPFVLQAAAANHPAKLFRRAMHCVVETEGICDFNGDDDLKVNPNSPEAMNVVVERGGAWIVGDTTTDQGMYFVYNDGDETITLDAADATNPRKDLIIAKIEDATEDAGSDSWLLTKVTGTPAASPSEPALPDSALKLAVVDVPANDTTIGSGQITDTRKKWNRLAGTQVRRTTDFNSASGGAAEVIPWDAEDFDSDDIHSTTANTGRFTVPTGLDGDWKLSWGIGRTGSIIYTIRKNGTTVYTLPAGVDSWSLVLKALVGGDYIEVFGQVSGGTDPFVVKANSRVLFERVGR